MKTDRFDWLLDASPETYQQLAEVLTKAERAELAYHWNFWARDAQLAPSGDWRIWLVLAGRGFGKTRAGAEWVRMIAEGDPSARICLLYTSPSPRDS